mmetsp:Transcript_58614/g.164431  ORF Transcript_58614/g.164431 Transcript_58614/m.164431 type:complete len:236 (-) Transcript_58614:513-1220(-)
MPCDLCTLTAQASSSGSCSREPKALAPHLASKVSMAIATSTPVPCSPAVWKETTGRRKAPAPSKPMTTPCAPLTRRRRRSMVRLRMTKAPTFNSKTRRAPVRWSNWSGLPLSTAKNITDSLRSASSARTLTDSTSDRSGISLVTARFPRPSYATRRSRSSRSNSSESSPNRTWLRMSVKVSSPFCLKTSVNSKVLVTERQAGASKQNLTSRPLATTGGNCMKSPVRTSWMPPNGF